jgi:DNA-binding transcriptional ArsR family regulator
MTLAHPSADQLDLPTVLAALSDPTRLAIVRQLAAGCESMCSGFGGHGSKSALSYHFARLREAGITRTRVEGTARYIALRRGDLDARFPGLLDSILRAAADCPAVGDRTA